MPTAEGADQDEDAEADRLDEPDYSTASQAVGRADRHGRLTQLLVWLTKRIHLVAGVALGVAVVLVLVLDVQLSRSQIVVVGSFALAAVVFGWPTGSKAADLLGGPQLMWLVDVDLLDRDGAGVYSCPTPRWSEEWQVTKDELWWATPNLAFGKHVDVEAQTVEGTWPGSLPEPVLMRALSFLRYNRQVLEAKAKRGEHIELNAFGMVRSATVAEMRKIVRTFEEGTLPDDNEAFLAEVDAVLDEYGLGDELPDPGDDADDGGDVDLPPDGAAAGDGFKFDVTIPPEAADD